MIWWIHISTDHNLLPY